MTRYVNRWTALIGWTALMALVWALIVPGGLSILTFTLLALTGPLMLVAGSTLWRAQRPSPSVGQMLADMDSPRTNPRVSK